MSVSWSLEEWVLRIQKGERAALGRAITLVESDREGDRDLADQLLEKLLPFSGKSFRIGVSGVPGVGKSTFIEVLGKMLTAQGLQVAVLAVDPSSQITGGSILGDKTRMGELAIDPKAFIRPSPSSGSLGGVARATREALLICEAAGFNVIFVETVGVGQSEVVVSQMVDLFLALMLPGGGDELQGIKRGLLEHVDLLVINKADGERTLLAEKAQQDYQQALQILRHGGGVTGAVPKVLTCSALHRQGIKEVWDSMLSFQKQQKNSGAWELRRSDQAVEWLWQNLREELLHRLQRDKNIKGKIELLEKEVRDLKLLPRLACKQILAGTSLLYSEKPSLKRASPSK